MKRRNLLFGIGAVASGSAAAVGSGAFSSVDARRTVSVTATGDANAFLRMTPVGRGRRSYVTDVDKGLVQFEIPGADEKDYPGAETDPNGVGTDSVYRFRRDADPTGGEGLVKVQNQGTNPIRVYGASEEKEGKPKVRIFDALSGKVLDEDHRSEVISPGDGEVRLGLEIDTRGVDVRDDEYDVKVKILAEMAEEY